MTESLNKFQIQLITFIKDRRIPLLSKPIMIQLLEIIIDIKFLRYLIIGFTTFALYYFAYQIMLRIFDNNKVAANMTASLVSMGFNFISSNFWTFKKTGKSFRSKIIKYGILQIYNYSFNNFAFYFLVIVLGFADLLAMVIITGMIVSWNFLLYRFWIFKY